MNKTKKYKQQGKMSAPQNEGKAELEGHVQRDRPACTGTGRARPCDTMAPLLQFTVTSPLTEEGRREPRPPHDFLCTPPPVAVTTTVLARGDCWVCWEDVLPRSVPWKGPEARMFKSKGHTSCPEPSTPDPQRFLTEMAYLRVRDVHGELKLSKFNGVVLKAYPD